LSTNLELFADAMGPGAGSVADDAVLESRYIP
jgi:hypothetical protein